MDWVKRNLFFVVGGVIALALLGGAGFYFYSAWKANGETLDQLHQQYATLQTLNGANPHPGRPPQSDNIKLAKEQQQELRAFKDKAQKTFQRIPSIPEGPKVAGEEFITSLRRTIDQLQKVATNSSVTLPVDYSFSFGTQRQQMRFAAGSLEPLSVQLGEVKAICDVLFQAKVNSIEYIHRERVAPEDSTTAADYLNHKSVTNDLAVLTPYEVKFKCFSPELAGAISGFASSPFGLIVKTINVEPAPAAEMSLEQPAALVTPVIPTIPQPVIPPQPGGAAGERQRDREFRSRYGLDRRAAPTPAPIPQPVMPQATAPARPALQTVLDEKQLLVTMMLNVVKILPSK